MTLHLLGASAQVAAPESKIRTWPANFALDGPASFALGWESSRGGYALGTWLAAGDVGLQQDYETGTGDGGVHRGH
jgi:hypothetical protein